MHLFRLLILQFITDQIRLLEKTSVFSSRYGYITYSPSSGISFVNAQTKGQHIFGAIIIIQLMLSLCQTVFGKYIFFNLTQLTQLSSLM